MNDPMRGNSAPLDAVGLVLARARAERGAAVMGILNVTPDSFFDGGRYTTDAAIASRLEALIAEGADLIDIGAESSRPGAVPVPPEEQLRRLTPAVRLAVERGAVVSVDTTHAAVAGPLLNLGARIVNDVSCLADPELARVAAAANAHLVIMHSRGPLGAMAGFSQYPDRAYGDVVEDVAREWSLARDRAVEVGLPPDRIWCDPGIGFAKNAKQSFELLRRTADLLHQVVGRDGTAHPVLIGASRKSFISSVDPCPPEERLGGTIAASLLAAFRGASVLRVHDVRAVRQALSVAREMGAGLGEAGLGELGEL
jgi:dihydropteroate synthase